MRTPVDCVAAQALRLCSKRAVQPARSSRMSLRLLAVIAVAACAVEASVRKVCAAGQSTAIWPRFTLFTCLLAGVAKNVSGRSSMSLRAQAVSQAPRLPSIVSYSFRCSAGEHRHYFPRGRECGGRIRSQGAAVPRESGRPQAARRRVCAGRFACIAVCAAPPPRSGATRGMGVPPCVFPWVMHA